MKARIVSFMSYFLIVLFVYASVSKLIVFQDFQVQLTQSPLLSAYANLIAFLVILVELVISVLLAAKKTRLVGLYLSYLLMVAFSLYIYLILNYSDFIPCSCGGVLESLSWNEHLWFNIIVCCLTITAAYLLECNYKRFWFAFILTTIMGSGLVIGAFLSSEHIIKKENPFIRRYLPHGVVEDKKLDLGVNSFYFAGSHKDEVYLGNVSSIFRFIKVDSLLTRQEFTIQTDSLPILYSRAQLRISHPYFYLADGTVPIIFKGKIKEDIVKQEVEIFSYNDTFFLEYIPVDSLNIVFKAIDNKQRKTVLGTINTSLENRVKIVSDLLPVNSDGVFDIDGHLSYSTKNKDILYTYLYRNQFEVIDTTLSFRIAQNTIDTTKNTHISSKRLSSGENKMTTPIRPVNRKSKVYGDLLFIVSNSLAKNDSKELLDKATVIDVYNFKKNDYIASFYINNLGEDKLSDFIITDHYLFGLFDKKLVRYKLANSITNKL